MTTQPKASAAPVAAAKAEAAARPKAELAVVATNGHTNGHAANGNGNGAAAAPITLNLGGTKVSFQTQADAPSCADCGSIMVRNGSCYKCLNCGSTSRLQLTFDTRDKGPFGTPGSPFRFHDRRHLEDRPPIGLCHLH